MMLCFIFLKDVIQTNQNLNPAVSKILVLATLLVTNCSDSGSDNK